MPAENVIKDEIAKSVTVALLSLGTCCDSNDSKIQPTVPSRDARKIRRHPSRKSFNTLNLPELNVGNAYRTLDLLSFHRTLYAAHRVFLNYGIFSQL